MHTSTSNLLVILSYLQVTLVEFGRFRTKAFSSCAASDGIFTHPAYKDMPATTSNVLRAMNGNVPLNGDPKKAAKALWKLSKLENPPLRLALGKDAVEVVRRQADLLKQGADEFANWSNDLECED
jgi:hypothetical protein